MSNGASYNSALPPLVTTTTMLVAGVLLPSASTHSRPGDLALTEPIPIDHAGYTNAIMPRLLCADADVSKTPRPMLLLVSAEDARGSQQL
jgi:hypothetical protein